MLLPTIPPINSAMGETYKGQVLRSAREFEGMLLESILGPLQKSFSMAGEGGSAVGNDAYQSLGTQALARALAQRGGFGVAEKIERSLCKPAR